MKKKITEKYGILRTFADRIETAIGTAHDSTDKLSAALMFALAKNQSAMVKELETYDKRRDAIIAECSGGATTISKNDNPEAFEKAVNELAELAEIEADTVTIRTVDVDVFENTVLAKYVPDLMFMINDEQEEDNEDTDG